MRSSGKSNKGGGGASRRSGGPEARKDRRSGSGMSGSPKKGGHGGKFTWVGPDGRLGFSDSAAAVAAVVDAKDPNFEDPEEAEEESRVVAVAAAV
ncbi:hypothetical protein Scep_008121 [Stephania cephalantha]|uniref:Programmed cell death protein 4 n=1 Tax=Stephania cephalantha TaxID=152367 RepID=A0AAP0PNV2_9MAGN